MGGWVRASVERRIFPRLRELYGFRECKSESGGGGGGGDGGDGGGVGGDDDGRRWQLSFRDLFFACYSAAPGGQRELALHRDGSVLSFNILLSHPPPPPAAAGVALVSAAAVAVPPLPPPPPLPLGSGSGCGATAAGLLPPDCGCDCDFEGGGTFFEHLATTVQLGRGDCLAHSGRVRHGGAAVTKGERIVLVGFVDVVEVEAAV